MHQTAFTDTASLILFDHINMGTLSQNRRNTLDKFMLGAAINFSVYVSCQCVLYHAILSG